MAYEEVTKSVNFPHSITLDSRQKLKITGVTDVESFDEYEVVLNTADGILTVEGTGLHMEKLTLDSGDVLVTGTVNTLKYENAPAVKGGLLSRLFG